MPPFYTRQEIIDAIALYPCHVTGLHDPKHTTEYVCELQLAESYKRLLEFLDVTVEELPRKVHENCYWCHGDPDTRKEPEELREWADKGA